MREAEVKARFFIEPKEAHNRVQHIGLRLAITEKLIRAGFTKGMVFNLPDGTVEVALEGKTTDVELFYNDVKANLVSWLESRTNDKALLKRMIGNPGISFTALEYKPNLRILDLSLFSHSLEMDQFSKGVDAFYELKGAILDLRATLRHQRGGTMQG